MKRSLRKSRKFEREFQRFQKNFGIVVRQLRKKQYLSRNELAGLAKFSQTTLEHVEQGKGNPSLGRMENLAPALRHRLSYIFKLTQDMDKQKDGA
jgi:transcriptional regulator with XRE-family HTH domain